MGRKKGSKNRKERTKTIGLDFTGGILIVIGIILLVFFNFENAGGLASITNEIFSGLFGIARYTLPIAFIYLGIECIALDKGINVVGEIVKGLITMALISSTIYIFTYGRFDIFDNLESFIRWSYIGGNTGENISGLVGALISALVYNSVGLITARILIVSVTLFVSLYFLNVGFRQFIVAIYNGIAAIIEWIINMFIIVFEKDEDALKAREDLKELKQKEKIRARDLELALKNGNIESKIKDGPENQIMFDLGNLDKKVEAAEKRDEFFKKQKDVKEEKDVKEVLQLDHIKHAMDEAYIFPPISLLQEPVYNDKGTDKKAIHATAVKLQKTLASFGVEAKVTNITKGPTVTRYELTPNSGVKVSKIVNLSDDIALNLAAKSIRIEAPIPGRAAVGIEVPNMYNEAVYLRDVIDSKEFDKADSKITFAIGKDTSGEISLGDIAKMPHVLIAGATGSGKSVCINAIITSILYNAKPSEVKLILVDPKMVELSGYNGIPHLLIPVVTDPKKAAGALNWAVQEMVNRYTLFASKGVKDIKGYNKIILDKSDKSEAVKLPQIVIIIDELADLMMVAPGEVEDAICRLAQMARAAGMHLVIATQRPSVDVITGIIKANIPSRIAFTVSSQIDSRTILDMAGAEKLLGKGDMLYFPVGESKPQRMQGAFVSEKEVENIVNFIKQNSQVTYNEDIIESIEKGNKKGLDGKDENNDKDELLEDAIDLVIDMGQASASMLQRRFKIGYARAGRIVDQMEMRGLVSGYDGSKPRNILVSKEEWQELKMSEAKEEE